MNFFEPEIEIIQLYVNDVITDSTNSGGIVTEGEDEFGDNNG